MGSEQMMWEFCWMSLAQIQWLWGSTQKSELWMKGQLGGKERETGFVCLYELNWMNWVEFGDQVAVLICSVFCFSATMATAPYNYSYIFKYIIIGKYHGAHTCLWRCVCAWQPLHTRGCPLLGAACSMLGILWVRCPASAPRTAPRLL